MPTTDGNEEWLIAVANRAEVEPERVKDILAAEQIYPSPIVSMPRRLTLRRLKFSGTKSGVPNAGPFEFDWDELTHGVWAMVSDRNLKGKSSIIEIVRWMLRGSPSDNLQEDVRSWISECILRFQLDETIYEVQVHMDEGLKGSLLQYNAEGNAHALASFIGDSEFEAVMSEFFMRELALYVVTRWRNAADGEGKSVIHGWAALSGVMFVGIDYSSLLGDVPPASGIITPLMQMYLGLPWISTLTAAKTASQGLRRKQEAKTRYIETMEKTQKSRSAAIQAELENKKQQLSRTPSDEDIRRTLRELGTEFAKKKATEHELEERLGRVTKSISDAETVHAEDRHMLQAHLDAEAAGAVFRMLDPSFCPRCDTEISPARKRQEESTHHCSICGERIASDEDSDEVKAQLTSRVEASRAALEKAQRDKQGISDELESVQRRIHEIEERIKALTEEAESFEERRHLEVEVAILEARLAEVDRHIQPEEADTDCAEILEAVIEETEDRVKTLQEDLLAKVSGKMLEYGQRFGIENLNALELKGNGNLPLKKGDENTSYSRVTAGEKLRLKVAAVLAMISVAEAEGVGRHPGLLMVDSPGAHEIAPSDLAQFVTSLQEVSRDFQHLQVFVAALATPAILENTQQDRTRYARGDDSLW